MTVGHECIIGAFTTDVLCSEVLESSRKLDDIEQLTFTNERFVSDNGPCGNTQHDYNNDTMVCIVDILIHSQGISTEATIWRR